MSNLEVRPTQFIRFDRDEVVDTRPVDQNVLTSIHSGIQVQDSVVVNHGMIADLNNYILQASSGMGVSMGYTSVVRAPITVSDVEKQLGVSSDLWDTVDPQELVTAIVTLARSI